MSIVNIMCPIIGESPGPVDSSSRNGQSILAVVEFSQGFILKYFMDFARRIVNDLPLSFTRRGISTAFSMQSKQIICHSVFRREDLLIYKLFGKDEEMVFNVDTTQVVECLKNVGKKQGALFIVTDKRLYISKVDYSSFEDGAGEQSEDEDGSVDQPPDSSSAAATKTANPVRKNKKTDRRGGAGCSSSKDLATAPCSIHLDAESYMPYILKSDAVYVTLKIYNPVKYIIHESEQHVLPTATISFKKISYIFRTFGKNKNNKLYITNRSDDGFSIEINKNTTGGENQKIFSTTSPVESRAPPDGGGEETKFSESVYITTAISNLLTRLINLNINGILKFYRSSERVIRVETEVGCFGSMRLYISDISLTKDKRSILN